MGLRLRFYIINFPALSQVKRMEFFLLNSGWSAENELYSLIFFFSSYLFIYGPSYKGQ